MLFTASKCKSHTKLMGWGSHLGVYTIFSTELQHRTIRGHKEQGNRREDKATIEMEKPT